MDRIIKLKETNLPFAYDHFEKETELPFIVYREVGTDNFMADDKVYKETKEIDIELYTKKKDNKLEQKLEKSLSSYFFKFKKYASYLPSEKMHETLYEIKII